MRYISLLFLILLKNLYSSEYMVVNTNGHKLNVRDSPIVNSSTLINSIPADAIAIQIRECKNVKDGNRWCYIKYQIGTEHIQGWVNAKYLKELDIKVNDIRYIRNFLRNFYKTQEELHFDKIKLFYSFPLDKYLDKRNVRSVVLRDMYINLNKKWPNIEYNLKDVDILGVDNSSIYVKSTFNWKFSNNKEQRYGEGIQKNRLIYYNDTIRIKSVEELKYIEFGRKSHKNIIQGKKFYIKVGSFFSEPNQKFLSNIESNGFRYIIKDDLYNGNVIKRVYIGPYQTKSDANMYLNIVKETINKEAYIKAF